MFPTHVIFFINVDSGMEILFCLEILEYKENQEQSILILKCIY